MDIDEDVDAMFNAGNAGVDLDALLTRFHGQTFDRCRSGFLRDDVLEQINEQDLIDRVDAHSTSMAWIRDADLLQDPDEAFRRAMRFLRIDTASATPTAAEATELVDVAIAKQKMILGRLLQLLCLRMEPGVQRRTECVNATICAIALCDHLCAWIKDQWYAYSKVDLSEVTACNDAGFFNFSWINPPLSTPFQMLATYVLRDLHMNRLRRYGDVVYGEVSVDGHRTHAWEPLMNHEKTDLSIREYVHRAASKDTNPIQWSNMTATREAPKQLADYLVSCCDHEFPVIDFDRHYISFENGIYHTRSNTFHAYGHASFAVPEDVVSMNYLPHRFQPDYATVQDWRDIPTPLMDSILAYQEFDEHTIECVYWALGRLFYEVGELDNWQVGMFIKGIGGTGKSTIADLIKYVFPKHLCGTLSSNLEEKFGLSAFYDKFVFVCTEVKTGFQLDQGDWQSMISGETVSVAVKCETAQSIEWKVPGLLCGNELPGWVDAAGSVIRRLLMFDFMKAVKKDNTNTALPALLRNDIAAFVCKCNRAYLDVVQRYGDMDIWSSGAISDQMQRFHKELRLEVSPIHKFLNSNNVVVGASASFVSESDFKLEYKAFMHEQGEGRPTWIKDHWTIAFEEYGIRRERGERLYHGKLRDDMWLVGVSFPAAF